MGGDGGSAVGCGSRVWARAGVAVVMLVVAAPWTVGCDDEGGGGGAASGGLATGGNPGGGGVASGGGGIAADGGGLTTGGATGDGGSGAPAALRLPPTDGGLDYQLGGAYPPPTGVSIVSRDRHAAPAPGLYNVCYVNGFQVQPGEEGDWEADLVLRDDGGVPIIDADWDEQMLDVSTPDKRARIAAVVGGFIAGCADDGYDAIEVDNLDSYTRSQGRIDQDDAVAMMAALSEAAHARGLPIAQKNAAELLPHRQRMGTDFSVAEECARWDECQDYVDAYGAHVLMIEYRARDFAAACADHTDHPIVLRDLELRPAGTPGYVYEGC